MVSKVPPVVKVERQWHQGSHGIASGMLWGREGLGTWLPERTSHTAMPQATSSQGHTLGWELWQTDFWVGEMWVQGQVRSAVVRSPVWPGRGLGGTHEGRT